MDIPIYQHSVYAINNYILTDDAQPQAKGKNNPAWAASSGAVFF